ncbi:MAG: hypothetical protein H6718_21470 [Polyangiaceae bacterium]|nr:hypothetical protein [Myxococcales bacterium]MCB9587990.1 hypothetical protein [Polyangiaceae bacterium]
MWYPFHDLDRRQRGQRFLLWVLIHTVIMLGIGSANARLVTEAAPGHIVSLELAGTLEQARAILASWDREQQLFAVFGIGADYLYIFVYGTLLAAGAAWGALVFKQGLLSNVGVFLSRAMIVAGLADAVENYAMLQLFWGEQSQGWVSLAYYCASLKFLIVISAIVYSLLTTVAAFTWRRLRL